MSNRLRVVGWQVRPVCMVDDGENLTPLPVQPLEIAAEEWESFKAGGDQQAIDGLRERVETPEEKPAANRAQRRSRAKPK